MKSSFTAAMEVTLNQTPLELLIMAEARMARYRQTATSEVEARQSSIRKSVSDLIREMRSDHTIPVYHYSRLFKVTIDLDYCKNRDPVFPRML
jgi:hypothetical protein